MQATLHFEDYVLDLERGCLVRGGVEVPLRPKTFGVLTYLAQHAGSLVSKEDLFSAVWPNVVVTDDALVQSIGELRRALGVDGPRLITTVPRRGYRFEATVSNAQREPARATGAAPPQRRRDHLGVLGVLGVIVALLLAWGAHWLSRVDEPPARPPKASRAAIAVLPFGGEAEDAAHAYFAEGLTQDLINALGRFPELTVMSWNAVQPYRGNAAPPARVAADLGVQYQVEGSVVRTGERVRVIAQLVDPVGRVRWSGRFEEGAADLFALHERITRDIAGALALRVTRIEQSRASANPSGNLEAYDYVLRARSMLQRPTRAGNVEARALLRRAIEIDPASAPAHSALADTYHLAVAMGWAESPMQSLGRAEELANKAIALDGAQTGAHVTLGRIHLLHNRYDQADAELRRAIAINPSDAHAIAGLGNVLMWRGETRAAVEALERAQRIDPALNAMDRIALALGYYLDERYDRAVQQLEINLRDGPAAHPARVILAAAYARQDRAADAARMAESVRRVDPTFDPATFGSKLQNPAQLERLREGMRRAGLDSVAAARPPG